MTILFIEDKTTVFTKFIVACWNLGVAYGWHYFACQGHPLPGSRVSAAYEGAWAPGSLVNTLAA